IAATMSTFQKLWNSPVGPKTSHFWAPVAKMCVAAASFADYFRPAEQISMSQQGALMVTGSIWTRWCFVITPKNYALAAINASVGLGGGYQFFRV
ncbi:mitochondrial pyruvate carrier, partial [Protomyces lactucae-debilis]